MNSIAELVQSITRAVAAANGDDLPGLAQLHGLFQEAAARLGDFDTGLESSGEAVKQCLGAGEKLVERIILNEVDDADAALQEMAGHVKELCSLAGVQPAAATPTGSAAPSATVACSAPAAAPAEAAEDVVKAEDASLVVEFVSEANTHLTDAEAELLKIEENPHNIEAINTVFRAFHSIKGVAGFLNLRQIGSLAHSTESLLDLARKGVVTLWGDATDAILQAIDLMKELVNLLPAAVNEGRAIAPDLRTPALLARLGALAGGSAHAAAPAKPAVVAASKPTVRIEAPSAQDASDLTFAVPAAEPRQPSPPTAAAAVPVAVAAEAAAPPPPPAQAERQAGGAAAEATVKVATGRLDSLINTVGELVIAQAMVSQDAQSLLAGNHRLARNLAHLGKLTRELQELSMSMRMVPIHGVFQKMSRLVRDLAKKSGKELELNLVGGDTELDRNLVEAITDPLVHMVRNSADHGIEMPDDREQSGKPRTGTIELKAYHHSGNIVIEITDDGKGLPKAKLVKKAVAAGIVAQGAQLSEQDIFKLVFHAGLSTAEKVTDVSGRGVGMDVVKRNVEALRGRIDIASVEGKGATFAIRLPLTLAVIDGLVVKVGPARFILPILSVEQSLAPKAEQLSTIQGRGEMCMVRDSLLPLYRLNRLLGGTASTEDPTKALVVIVQDDDRRCCLMVDELMGQQQVVIKSLGEGVGKIRGISGGAILGDGNVSLILDVPSLIDAATGR